MHVDGLPNVLHLSSDVGLQKTFMYVAKNYMYIHMYTYIYVCDRSIFIYIYITCIYICMLAGILYICVYVSGVRHDTYILHIYTYP